MDVAGLVVAVAEGDLRALRAQRAHGPADSPDPAEVISTRGGDRVLRILEGDVVVVFDAPVCVDAVSASLTRKLALPEQEPRTQGGVARRVLGDDLTQECQGFVFPTEVEEPERSRQERFGAQRRFELAGESELTIGGLDTPGRSKGDASIEARHGGMRFRHDGLVEEHHRLGGSGTVEHRGGELDACVGTPIGPLLEVGARILERPGGISFARELPGEGKAQIGIARVVRDGRAQPVQRGIRGAIARERDRGRESQQKDADPDESGGTHRHGQRRHSADACPLERAISSSISSPCSWRTSKKRSTSTGSNWVPRPFTRMSRTSAWENAFL